MCLSDHAELISTLKELWTLLDSLAACPPNMIALPPSDTGVHPSSTFNADSARAGGFTDEAVQLLAALPYLKCPLEIQPDTYFKCYLGLRKDERDFEEQREMLDHEPIVGSAIVLTDSSGDLGCYYVYDTEKSK